MENEMWKMMINNAAEYLKNLDPDRPEGEGFSIWQISEILALTTGKTIGDVALEIINESRRGKMSYSPFEDPPEYHESFAN